MGKSLHFAATTKATAALPAAGAAVRRAAAGGGGGAFDLSVGGERVERVSVTRVVFQGFRFEALYGLAFLKEGGYPTQP